MRRPVILCEYAHAMGNSGGCLAKYWAHFRDSQLPRFQGGFIWDFIDQGLALPSNNKHFGYGGDFGDFPNTKNFCCNGIMSPDRKPFPTAKEAAHLQSPVMVEVSYVPEGGAKCIYMAISNRFIHSDLSDVVVIVTPMLHAAAINDLVYFQSFEVSCSGILPQEERLVCLDEPIIAALHKQPVLIPTLQSRLNSVISSSPLLQQQVLLDVSVRYSTLCNAETSPAIAPSPASTPISTPSNTGMYTGTGSISSTNGNSSLNVARTLSRKSVSISSSPMDSPAEGSTIGESLNLFAWKPGHELLHISWVDTEEVLLQTVQTSLHNALRSLTSWSYKQNMSISHFESSDASTGVEVIMVRWSDGSSASIGRQCGRLLSWVNNRNKSVIDSKHPLDICLYRAPTDNDKGGGGFSYAANWKAAGLDRLERKDSSKSAIISCQSHQDAVNGACLVIETAWVLAPSSVMSYRNGQTTRLQKDTTGIEIPCKCTYTFKADGAVEVNLSAALPVYLPPLPRFGVRFAVNRRYEVVRWFGLGPHEAYDDRKESAYLGVFRSHLSQLFTHYTVPQECGRRADPRYIQHMCIMHRTSIHIYVQLYIIIH